MIVSTPTALVAAAPTLFRRGLVTLLQEQCPALRLTLTADASEVADLIGLRKFGLIVLDGALPGLDLPAVLEGLHRSRPTQRLLVLADPREPAVRRAAPAWSGTQLLVPPHVPPHALAAVLAPWLATTPEAGAFPIRVEAPYLLAGSFSRRELEVLRLVVADQCNEEIADHLCLSVRTVESHRRTLLQKAGTRTLVGLAARAVREGWVA
ncbi:MAG TPA: response regulator transcription factor [Hymenobacter sp.]|uniref:helix-turn-helix transcriptional regulator n=1 Tax=Hymenobacter sp. TaxID=1898978 RepID=UPI002EDA2D81